MSKRVVRRNYETKDVKVRSMVWSMHIPPEHKQLVIDKKMKTHGCMIHTSDGEWIEID